MLLTIFLAACSTPQVQTKDTPHSGGPLHDTIRKADRIVVYEDPTRAAKVLYESRDRRDIEALLASLKLGDPFGVCCLCIGSPAIRLYRGEKEIGSFTNHHALLVRSRFWDSDVPILDQESYLKWFDDRGIAGPRKEVNYQREESRQAGIAVKRWEENMPSSIRPIWRKLDQIMPDRAAPAKTLAAQIPEKNARIMALFSWFGSGRGPWSGFPGYETLAEMMLLDYDTAELLTAVESRKGLLSDQELEGVARLLGGWEFSQKKKGEISLVPAPLRARLLAHCLTSSDKDKVGRARTAFSATD